MKRVIFVFLCLVHPIANAGIGDEINQMLGSSIGSPTFTPLTTLTANKLASTTRIAAQFPGLRVRSSVKNFNLVNFSPPRLSAGCNGIDMTLGSFSMVSKDELISMFRSIASNALSYGFGQAIQAMCPPCWAGMKSLQEDITAFNQHFGNTCAMAMAIVDDPTGAWTNTKCSLQAAVGSIDYAECQTNANSSTDQTAQSQKDVADNTAAEGFDPASNFGGGNLMAHLIDKQGAPSDALKPTITKQIFGVSMFTTDVMINLLGTYVLSKNDGEAPDIGHREPLVKDYTGLVFARLKDATDKSSALWECATGNNASANISNVCGIMTERQVPTDTPTLDSVVREGVSDLFAKMVATPFDMSSLTEDQKSYLPYLETSVVRAMLMSDMRTKQKLQSTSELMADYITLAVAEGYLQDVLTFSSEIIAFGTKKVDGAKELLGNITINRQALQEQLPPLTLQKKAALTALMNNKVFDDAHEKFGHSVAKNVMKLAQGSSK